LEARLRKALEPSQATPLPSSSAAQIDNESLRDQVLHLQKKITGLEDTLDDVQSASERDANAQRERLKRAKDKEDAMKKEMIEGRKELERILKLEDNARTRVQEIEEALRESTMALENARAEVEGMRVELGVSASNI
jgi:CAP-Gly domain-containing linker protein 1